MATAQKNLRRSWLWLVCLGIWTVHPACADAADAEEDGGTDADADADSDADTGSDSGGDTDAVCADCQSPVCIAGFSGAVLHDDGAPAKDAMVQICFPNCYLAVVDDKGDFVLNHAVVESMPKCAGLDFSQDDPIHVIFLTPEEAFTRYAVACTPDQSQIGGDHALDLGTHVFSALPQESAGYTAADGAIVDLSGVQLELGPEDLLDAMNAVVDEAQIKVLALSGQDAVLPFVDNPFFENDTQTVDLLYYLAPYLTVIASDGVVLTIDPPDDGWAEGDTAALYFLGDYIGGFDPKYISCDGQDLPVGELRRCGSAEVQGGKLVTDPITGFSWIGLKKE